MEKIFNFFKTPLGIGILVVIAAGLLFWGLSANYKLNLVRAMQTELDDINAGIAQAQASHRGNVASLMAEKDDLIKFIQTKL